MNITFPKFNEHTQTEQFLDMLYANNILLIITKPTRLTDHTATLIDHIYITYVVVNFLFQVIFIFLLFLGMVIYANEVETKEK